MEKIKLTKKSLNELEESIRKGAFNKVIFIFPKKSDILLSSAAEKLHNIIAVSYTHLTLPTICSV